MGKLTSEEHKKRHQELHKYFDELFADFIFHTEQLPSKTTVMEFMQWSDKQCRNPTESSE